LALPLVRAGLLSSVFEPNFICRSTSPPAPSPTERGINWKSLSVGEGLRVRFLRELNSSVPLAGGVGGRLTTLQQDFKKMQYPKHSNVYISKGRNK
jgi:hypothetical protein